jgi:superfamily II DNA or RNA helicase
VSSPEVVSRDGDECHNGLVRHDLLGSLRAWQREAFGEYFRQSRRDFLVVATPGAGKTAYALSVAAELLARREVASLTVVTPTEHLKHQWAASAMRFGIALDSAYRNSQGRASADFAGVAVTYAQVAAHPALHRQRTEGRRTLVIFDEIHHAGDALSWGDAVREAFDPARRRLGLTGTPFRSDTNPIPFVTYEEQPDGSKRSASDYVYGYAPALEDGVVRPVIFLAYSGEMSWRTRAGDEITATLGTPMTKDQIAQAWRTALDPAGEWVARVLEAADRRLTEVRRGMPDAAGLVIAGDHEDARAYAALLRRVTGKRPVVVLSDDPTASRKIGAFAASDDRWMVAVRMVSEGVDIPRLAVGVYATSVSTALFFAQAVGRFVRARRRGETASVFVPSVPVLLGYAAELEAERDHILARASDAPEEQELAEAQRRREVADELVEAPFEVLHASAHFDRVLYDGGEFGTATAPGSPEEEDFLGLPGLLEPGQVAELLRKRQAEQLRARPRGAGGGGAPGPESGVAAGPGATVIGFGARGAGAAAADAPGAAAAAGAGGAGGLGAGGVAGGPAESEAPPVSREALAALRKELNGLVAAWNHRTGQPHGVIHNDLRKACGGPALPQATAGQIRARIDMIRHWAATRR